MISITKPIVGLAEIYAVSKVLWSRNLVQGKQVLELEKKFCKVSNTPHAIAVNSGTAALHVGLFAAGIKSGDEIISTPFTFVATANTTLMSGAKPIFVDIEHDTFNINPDLIEAKITPKTKAILTVDLYGQMANYTKIKAIAKKHNLLIIEDSAQAVGASYHGEMSGEVADIACVSLYATKNVMCGEGGMVTAHDPEMARRAMLFRQHGQYMNKPYDYHFLGYNYRLTDIAAAIANVQMDRLAELTEKRRQNARYYQKHLKDVSGLIIPQESSQARHVYHQFTIRVTPEFSMSRDKLKEKLAEDGIGTSIYYP